MLVLRRPRTTQPQQAVRANTDWLERGLVALFDQRNLVEVVNGLRPSSHSAALVPTVGGAAPDYSGTANTQYAHHPAFATTGAFTIVTFFDVDTHTNFGALIAKQGTTTTNAPYELRIGPASSGDSRINLLRASAGSFVSTVVSSSNLIPTLPAHRQMLIVTGTSASIGTSGSYYINGVGSTYTGAGGANCTDNGASVWIGRRYDGATQLDGRIYYIALFNRAITDQEARQIYENPWRLFEPISQNFWAPGAGGGGDATATGATLTSTSSLTAGAASGAQNPTATGATLTSTSSFTAGAASGVQSQTAAGATLTSIGNFIAGLASATRNPTANGVTLTSTSSFTAGAAFASTPGTGLVQTILRLALSIGI